MRQIVDAVADGATVDVVAARFEHVHRTRPAFACAVQLDAGVRFGVYSSDAALRFNGRVSLVTHSNSSGSYCLPMVNCAFEPNPP
jgi:hypothetical protein